MTSKSNAGSLIGPSPHSLLAGLLSVPAMFITAWGWWSHSGPYAWVVAAELRFFGGYELTISLVVTLVVVMSALGLVVSLARRLLRDTTFGRWLAALDDRSFESDWSPTTTYFAAGVGLILFGVGLWRYAAWTNRSAVISATEVDAGVRPTGGNLVVTGYPVPELVYQFTDRKKSYVAAPLAAAPGVVPNPIRIIVVAREKSGDVDSLVQESGEPISIRGTTAFGGTPGILAAMFAEGGLQTDRPIVVNAGERPLPEELGYVGLAASAFGSAGVVAAIVNARRILLTGTGFLRIR